MTKYKFPWKETPILYGEDAIRFEKEMERVDNMRGIKKLVSE